MFHEDGDACSEPPGRDYAFASITFLSGESARRARRCFQTRKDSE